ncbi:MAG: thiamine phosphate synthase [Candidatus Omnitrophica bacterium]|nr:thiamine phosphate synthase [Candidatus Omnitrophota bacterium]
MKSYMENKRRLERSHLYAVTDLRSWSPQELFRIEEACRGGVDIIQLRSKVLERHALEEAGKSVRKITEKWNVLFIVNDFPDIALAVAADGVHLGQEDVSIAEARNLFRGQSLLIGKSTHNISEAVLAQNEGADYIGVGPIFSTPTKPDYPVTGLEWLAEVKRRVRIPAVAIGGIDEKRVSQIIATGIDCVAVVRAIFGVDHVYEAASRLKQRVGACITDRKNRRVAKPEKAYEKSVVE